MWNAVFMYNGKWMNFTAQHYISFFIFGFLGFLLIRQARLNWSKEQQYKYWFYLCIFLFLSQYAKMLIKWQLGTFDYHIDLPLELCNMLPIFMSIAVYTRSRKWWGIFFFWIMAGTFQANLTPTLADAFPHYEYFRYWIIHMGLSIAALYGVFVIGYRVTLKDAFRAFIWLNIVAWSMYVVNWLIDTNYMYMQGKPPGETIYNLLGDWPIYLLQCQFVLWVLFLIILLPFWIYRRMKKA